MERVKQEVEWHAPLARRTAMQATVHSHLDNTPASGRPGDAFDPGFRDVPAKLLQLVCYCLSSQLLEHWPDSTFWAGAAGPRVYTRTGRCLCHDCIGAEVRFLESEKQKQQIITFV